MENTRLRLFTYMGEGIEDTLFPDANNPIEIGAFRYDAKRMGGAPIITASVNYPSCLDDEWTDNVYAEFNGEKYFLKQTPTSSYDNEDTMYKHDIELVSERIILDNVYFFDAVKEGEIPTDDKPVSNSTKVVFFGDVKEFAKRLQASLSYSGIDYSVIVDDKIKTEEKLMSFEDQFFSNVLQEIYNVFEVPYYFVGKTIHIGFANDAVVPPTFAYGVDDALLSITKNNANFKVVNRATGKGSTENIPFYYPNNSPKGDIEARSSSTDMSVTITDAELYANKVALDGVIKYEDFSVSEETMTSEYGAYESGEEIHLNKITGTAKRDFDLSFFASNSGKFTLNLDYAINNVKNPIKGSVLSSDTISCRFSVTLINARGESLIIAKSVESGGVEIPIASSGSYVARITMEFASTRSDNTLTCDYKLHYSLGRTFTGWTYDGKEVKPSEIGLAINGAVAGDTITQKLVKYVKTSQNLMPSIYRETDGAERFYNALSNTYVIPNSVPEEKYEFSNPYVEGKPKEHIVDFEDIKPTIKEATNEISWVEKDENGNDITVFQRIDMFSEFAYDEPDSDETYEDEEDNNDVKYKHSYFFAKLRKLPFNLFDHAIENQPMTISFTSGDCGACKFTIGVTEGYPQKNPVRVNADGTLERDEEGRVVCGVNKPISDADIQEKQQDTTKEEVWIALLKEEETYGIVMPKAPDYDENGVKLNEGHLPKACNDKHKNDGDSFVILGINLPKEYILAAEKKLEEEIIKYMKENNEEKFTFSIGFSRIYFEENPSVLQYLNENSRINVTYNGKTYFLYVTSYSYQMSEGDALPQISVELDESLTVSQNALQNAISEVKTEVGRALSNIDVLALSNPYFIRKDIDDEAQGKINFKKGVKFGEGGKVEVLDNNSAKLTIEYLEVTKKASFTSLEIQEKTHVGGQMLITPAAINCGEVEEFDDFYRCYFQTKGVDGDEIFNQFAIGDQAISQTYNAWGSRYYWRLVVGIGEDYIDLSKTDCDEDSDIPMAGDKIIQLGHRTDKARQAAQVLSAYGDDAPSFIMYNGIDDFSLEGKNITGIIWNPETQEPQMYSYGSFFFGDRELNDNFITFQKRDGDTEKTLSINADIHIGANSSGLTNLSEWKEKQEQIDAATQGVTLVQQDVQNLQNQIDGVVENHYYEGVPTIYNFPTIEWATDDEKLNHIGDTYINIASEEQDPDNAGKAWRWCECTSVNGVSSFDVRANTQTRNWEKIGTLPNYQYQTFVHGSATFPFAYDTQTTIRSGPPAYIKVEGGTNDVYVLDVGGYFATQPLVLSFRYINYVEVETEEGTKRLHWHTIADTDAVKALLEAYKAQAGIDDLQYLKGTFGKSVDVDGVVMSEMVAVKSGNNIKAFINGSDIGEDEANGKLIIAAGIEDITKPEEANTRIYDNGAIIVDAKDIVGKVKIDDTGLAYYHTEENGDEMLRAQMGGSCTGASLVLLSHDASEPNFCTNAALLAVGGEAGRAAFFVGDVTIQSGILDARGSEIWCDSLGGGYVNNLQIVVGNCISAPYGAFKGLRPSTRVITTAMTSSNPNVLTELDFSVLVNATTGTYYIQLPTSPQDGQEYVIESRGANIKLTSTKQMWNHYYGKIEYSRDFMGVNSVRLKYYSGANMWTCTWLDYKQA